MNILCDQDESELIALLYVVILDMILSMIHRGKMRDLQSSSLDERSVSKSNKSMKGVI